LTSQLHMALQDEVMLTSDELELEIRQFK